MSKKKAAGAVKIRGNVAGKRRGIKIFGGEIIRSGQIIVRQLGTKYKPGLNVGLGRDFTIFSKIDGVVRFSKSSGDKTVVNVDSN